MRCGVRIAALSIAIVSVEPARGSQPFEAVRALQALDDRMAHGDLSAYAQRSQAWNDARKSLETATKDHWKDPRNVRAAIIWSLAGGGSATVDRLIADGEIAGPERPAANLASALAKGNAARARQLAAGVDVSSFGPAVAAAVGLAMTDRLGADQDNKGRELLAATVVRLAGTFFSEAAYRRLILWHFRKSDDARALGLFIRYLDSFPKSLFADLVIDELVASVREGNDDSEDRLVALLGGAIPRRATGPTVAGLLGGSRGALLAGRLKLATLLAELAIARNPGEDDLARARLYIGAARAPSGTSPDALESVGAARLPEREKALLRGVQAIAKRSGVPASPREATAPVVVTKDVIARGKAALAAATKEVSE